ncbi:MAG: transposase [Bryobacteraceae bacterium]
MGSYFITFSTFGHYFPGQPGFIDRGHNLFGSPLPPPQANLLHYVEHQIEQPRYFLDHADREIVLASIIEVCDYNGWTLVAAHVRSNHVHIVVEGEAKPERMMNTFKSYASRGLNATFGSERQRRWARHGSTRYLWSREALAEAVAYVIEGQGDAMSAFTVAEHSQPLWHSTSRT